MVEKDIITLTTVRNEAKVMHELFFVDAGTPVKDVERDIRLAVLDYISTTHGATDVLNSHNNFNWGDALVAEVDSFYKKHNIYRLEGETILLSGKKASIQVNHDEILSSPSYPTTVTRFDTLSIGQLFIYCPTDSEKEVRPETVYSQRWDYLSNHDEKDMTIRYSVFNPETGFILEEAEDFYRTIEEAEAFALSTGAKPIVNVYEIKGIELFNHVFQINEEDEEDELEQPESLYSIEEFPGVTNFEVTSEGTDDWYETEVATFKKDGHFYQIKESSHVSAGDSELLYDTMSAIR